MDYGALCDRVLGLSGQVVTAAVLKGQQLVTAGAPKPGAPEPSREELERMLFQIPILVGIPKTNEKAVGQVGYVMVNHGGYNFYLFPMEQGHILAVAVLLPYAHEDLVSHILELLPQQQQQQEK